MLSAIALLVWVGITAIAATIATGRITDAMVAERTQVAHRVADRVERAIDDELSRLYRQPDAATLPLPEQLKRTIPGLATVLHGSASEPYRVVLIDADSRELAASRQAGETSAPPLLQSEAPVGRTDWSIRVEQPLAETLGPIIWLRRLLVWSAILSCGFAILLAWGAALSVRRPILRLTSDAQRLARGDLKQPIAPAGLDEIGQLAAALEQMRRALVQDELLGRLLRKVIAAQEEERKRLARELHDETSQQLTALGLQLDLIGRELRADGLAAARLRDTRQLVGRMVDDLHRVIYDLRPSMLDDLGLLPAIRWYAERLTRRGVAVQFEFPEAPPDLTPEARIAVFRVVQEALSNVERHARAETVLVGCDVGPRELTIEVEDDGVGFDPEEMRQPRESGQGLGLLGMRERLALLGGTCVVESQPGNGTRVVVRVPLGPKTLVANETAEAKG